jgi:hypothetical protein
MNTLYRLDVIYHTWQVETYDPVTQDNVSETGEFLHIDNWYYIYKVNIWLISELKFYAETKA